MVKNAENWQKTWVSDISWDEWDAIFEYCYPVRVKLKSAIPLCSEKILLNVCLSILKGKRAIGSPYGVYLKQWALKMDKIHDGSSLYLSKCSRCTRQQQIPTDVL